MNKPSVGKPDTGPPPDSPIAPSSAAFTSTSNPFHGSSAETTAPQQPPAREKPSASPSAGEKHPAPRGPENRRPKVYKCSHCPKRFDRPSSLNVHMNSHTGDKPHVCEISGCGQRFSVRSNLRRHMRTRHRPERIIHIKALGLREFQADAAATFISQNPDRMTNPLIPLMLKPPVLAVPPGGNKHGPAELPADGGTRGIRTLDAENILSCDITEVRAANNAQRHLRYRRQFEIEKKNATTSISFGSVAIPPVPLDTPLDLSPLPKRSHVRQNPPSRHEPPPMQDHSKLPVAALRAKNRRPSLPELWEEGGRPTAIDFMLPQRIPPRARQDADTNASSSTHAKDGAQSVAPGMEYAHVPLQVQLAAAAAANPKGPMLPTPEQSDTSSMSGGGGQPPQHDSMDLMQQNQMNAAIQMAFAQSQQQSMMGSPYSTPPMPLAPLSLNPAMSDTSSMGSGMSYLELGQPPADPGPSSVAAALTTPHPPHAQAMMTNLGIVPTNNNAMADSGMMQPPDINPSMVSLSPLATLHPRIISPSQYSMGSHTFQTPFYAPGASFVNPSFNMIPSPVQPRLPMHTPCSNQPHRNHPIYAELATIGENMRRSGAASNAPIMLPASWGTPVRIASVQHPEISPPHSLSSVNLVTAEQQSLTQSVVSALSMPATDATQGHRSPQLYPPGQQAHFTPDSHPPEPPDHSEWSNDAALSTATRPKR